MIGSDYFGYDVDINAFFYNTLSSLPKLTSVDAKITMCDLYEHTYGIYRHVNNPHKSPLASVAMHPGEDYTTGSMLEDILETYRTRGIKDMFGISVLEFLELPIDIMETMLTVASKARSEHNEELDKMEKELRNK